MKKLLTIGAVAVAVLLLAAVAAFSRPETAGGTEAAGQRVVTVAGTGTVRAAPDQAELSFGVETRGNSAREALAANAREMRAVIAALHDAGVASDDVQTQSVSVWPITTEDGRTITGYSASNSVRATVDAIGRVGRVVDAAANAGANSISGPTFTREETRHAEERALELALADARRKADALASAVGARLGRVVRIVEASAQVEPLYERAALAASDSSTPIEGGTLETEATVTVTFALS